MASKRIGQMEEFFFAGFGSMAGIIFFMTIMAIYTLIWAGTGLFLLLKYNKNDEKGIATPLLKKMSWQQYLGIVLICIGLLPFLQYFFQSILFSAGWNFMSDLMDD